MSKKKGHPEKNKKAKKTVPGRRRAAKKPSTPSALVDREPQPEALADGQIASLTLHLDRARAGSLGDARLPVAGTTLVKRDRLGAPRCECTVEEAGIRYNGALYPSLSAAASAAAKALGLNATVNGYSFWGIIKPNRAPTPPAQRLRRFGERYEEQARELIEAPGASDDVLEELEKHVALVRRLLTDRAA